MLSRLETGGSGNDLEDLSVFGFVWHPKELLFLFWNKKLDVFVDGFALQPLLGGTQI